MRILLWHVHGSWTTSLVQGDHVRDFVKWDDQPANAAGIGPEPVGVDHLEIARTGQVVDHMRASIDAL